MNSETQYSNIDLEDLLSQAADMDSIEDAGFDGSTSKKCSVHSSSRRGMFAGRSTKPNAALSDQAGSSSAETTTGEDPPPMTKTPPKPVESPPELKPVMEGTPKPAKSKFLRLACACGYRMRIKEQNAGKTIKCPKCESSLAVPAMAASSSNTVHFRLEESFASRLSKVISLFDEEAKQLKTHQTLSRLAFRSLRISVESLSEAQFDKDRVRDALYDLGESGDDRAYEILRSAWEAQPGTFDAEILNAMGRSKDPRAVAFLLQLLTHHRSKVRLSAVQSLALTADARLVSPLFAYGQHQPEQKYVASDSILKIGKPAVTPLLELLLVTQDLGPKYDLVILLGRLKSTEAVKPLTHLLNSGDHSLQGHVAEALRSIGDPKSMTSLLPLLKSDDDKLRMQVASVFCRVPHPGCARALIKSLEDENLEVRKLCVAALGELGDNRAAPALVPFLKHSHTELRIAAAEALGCMGDRRAVPDLLKMIEDQDESVILKALSALRKIKEPAAAPTVMKLLLHENSHVRQRAIEVLGHVGDAVVAERLEQILKNDGSEEVRVSAAKALGHIGDAGSVDVLIDALHGSFSVRCRAIVALGEIGDEAALPALLAMLKEPAPELKYHATQALAELGHQTSIKSIQPLLNDSNAMVRRGAAKALESLGQGNAEQLLGSATQQGIRRGFKQIKNALAGLSPGTIADAIQHGSLPGKGRLAGIVLIPLLLVAGYMLYSGSRQTVESVALMRRGNVSSLDLAVDGSRVVVGRTTGVVEIWDLSSQQRSTIFAPEGLSGEIIGVSIVPNTQQLVLCSSSTAGGFDIESGKMLWQISGHKGTLHRFLASQDRHFVMVGSTDGVFSFWDAKTGTPIGAGAVTLPRDKTRETEMSNNGQMIAGVGERGPVTVWSTKSAEELAVIDLFAESTIVDLEFSVDDQSLSLSTSDGQLAIIDLKTQQVLQQIQEPLLTLQGFPQVFDKLKFNSEGSLLHGFLGGNKIFEMDLSHGAVTETDLKASLAGDAFGKQPGGTLFALGQDDESPVYVFDQKDGQQKAVLDIN